MTGANMAADEIARALDEAAEQVFGGSVPWKEDAQRDKAIEVARLLQGENAKPEGALRLYQATLASPRDPGAAKRASVLFVAERMKATLGTLASGPDRVGFVRVLAGAARAGASPDGVAARLTSRPAKSAVPTGTPLTPLKPLIRDNQAVITGDVTEQLRLRAEYVVRDQELFRVAWSSAQVNAVIDNVLIPAIRAVAVRAETGLGNAEAAVATLDSTRKNHHAVLKHLLASGPGREVDALWWSQALYSPSANAEYRDIETPALLPAMATDLIAVMGHEPDPSLAALYVESARRLIPSLDERLPWAVWLDRLLVPSAAALPEVYARLAKADATGLPISAWLLSGDDPVGAPEAPVTGREIARRYFRERQLAAWIAEAPK